MAEAYDSTRDFCPKCIYCHKIYLNRDLLAYHFVTQHLLNKDDANWTCPHCPQLVEQQQQPLNILAHVQQVHPCSCLFCGNVHDTNKDAGVSCTHHVQIAIKHYFAKKISLLFNMLRGLETI